MQSIGFTGKDIIREKLMTACKEYKITLEGKKVYLEFDTQQRDNYERLLCYLYLEDHLSGNLCL